MTQRAPIVVLGIQDAATHVIPNLPLLSRLSKLGYRPIIVSGEKPRFRARIEQLQRELQREGVKLEWISAGPNWSVSAWTWYLGRILVQEGNDAMNRDLFYRYLTDPEANIKVAETIQKIHKEVGPVELVICDPSLAGAFYGAKKVGAKPCILENGLARLMLEQHEYCRPNLDQIRRRLGLSREQAFPEMYTAPILVGSPKGVFHGDLNLDVLDFRKEMPHNSEPVPAWVSGLDPSEPFFYGSNGSTGDYFQMSPAEYHQRFEDANELMIQAALRLGLPGIASVGDLYDKFKHYTIPGRFEVVAHANQPALLAVAAKNGAVWGHGGYGTGSEGLLLGMPWVLYPGSTDQFKNCELLEESGVGIYLRRTGATVDEAARALEAVLTNPKYRKAAVGVQDQIAALPTLMDRVLQVLAR